MSATKRTPKKLPAVEGGPNPCLSCPPIRDTLKMYRRIAVGFGYAAVEQDGKTVWAEGGESEFADCWTVQKAENLARKSPKSDWRIVLDGPLHGETYQRQGRNLWVLVSRNQGFA